MEIITSHTNTDLDALASMMAAKKIYPEAVMVFPGKLSKNVEEFMSLHKDIFTVKSVKEINFETVKRIILVDTKNPKRVNKLADLFSRPGIDVHIYDHHPWTEGDVHGSLEVVEIIGATVTLLVEKIIGDGIFITPLEATVMALGIYGDTGSLLFTSTTARDAAAVSCLIERGANLGVVAEFLGRPMTEDQKDLLKTLLMSAERHLINGVRILIAKANTDEFVVGLSLLTHTISEIERLDAVFTLVMMEDRVYIVGRSNIPQIDVAGILGPFMGGGHPAAASATVKNGSVNELAEKLVTTIREKVKPPMAACDIMSCPVKTVFSDTSIAEANKVMMRYGHSGLPVVEGLILKGVISRRDVEKAVNHGLGHAPVKGYMTFNVVTVHPNMPVAEIREIMIENDIGRVPVVEENRLVGIVSRTDVLRTLHGDIQNGFQAVHNGSKQQSYYNNIGEVMRRGLSPGIMRILRQTGAISEELNCRIYAAGGVVRDILLGYDNIDVDIVAEGDGIALAEKIAERMGAKMTAHQKFGTAELIFPDGFKMDVATARVEYYEYPAALPQVERSSLRQDLYRRDFTINAMSVSLNQDDFGELVDYYGGREDLHYGLVRVLYNLSFIEDPTRILRAVRFEQRYKIQIEPQTLKLIKEAVKQQVLLKVSNDRLWDELCHIMLEPGAARMFARLDVLQVLPQVLPGVTYWEVQPVLKGISSSVKILREWGMGGDQTEPWLPMLIAVLHWSDEDVAEKICIKYSLNRKQTEKVMVTLKGWRDALTKIWKDPESIKISDLARIIMDLPKESYPLLMALLDEEWMKQRFKAILTAIKENKPVLNGKYIKSLGYKPGPLYRNALTELWRARLDGLVSSEEEEKEFLDQYLENSCQQSAVSSQKGYSIKLKGDLFC
ncbi:MAG: polynucleotide adenylyltransferase [Peptococcaceae bacterium BRH_c4a]|nr:MAG: polynucleotide adenylyltransferase [Peptococcaceae bacterium BRH_c4a]